MEKLIEEWKEKGVDRAEFEFSCGGDSMNDTSLVFFDKEDKEVIMSNESREILDNDIYKEVEFYENSDGHYQGEHVTVLIKLHYQGEHGTVLVEFDAEENQFAYSKSATQEWSESFTDIVRIEITPELHKFCKEYVLEISGESDYLDIEYAKDFYINSEKCKMLEDIKEVINEAIDDHEPEDTSAGELEDYVSMSNFATIDNNKIKFNYDYRKTVYN
jgi:hypothetical protein